MRILIVVAAVIALGAGATAYALRVPDKPSVAVEEGALVGFSLGRELVADGVRSGYVGDIGVRPAWQGRGLGHALLARSLTEFRSRGLASASLNVDA